MLSKMSLYGLSLTDLRYLSSEIFSHISHQAPLPPVFFSFPFQANNVNTQLLWEVKKPKSGSRKI